MATTSEDMAVEYPIPVYRFIVSIGDEQMSFSNVSGLDIGYETIEYRDGTGGLYLMPGQRQIPSITLQRGVFRGQTQLYNWISSISLNTVNKRDITISLTNDSGTELLITWNVMNAFPTKLTAPSLDASSNEIAVQELSLMADRITVQIH